MATLRLCSIPDCGKPNYGFGLCNKHYQAWRRHGDFSEYARPKEEKPTQCGADNCSDKVHCRGLCIKHYARLRSHGDPNKVVKAARGKPLEYVETVVLRHEGNECLMWPFYRTPTFYGQVTIKGKRYIATRYVCERAHGPAPSANHEAAHSCGRGHEGCISPGHLSWKTPSGNQADKIAHGTDLNGEKSPNAKLTTAQVDEIRALVGQMRNTEIAKIFGVSATHIGRIATYQARLRS